MSKKKSFETLQNYFGERWSVSLSDTENHGRSESYFPIYAPDAVVYPITTEDVVFLVNVCQEANIPLIWYGIGIKSIINDGASPRRALSVRIFNCDSDVIGDCHKNLLKRGPGLRLSPEEL